MPWCACAKACGSQFVYLYVSVYLYVCNTNFLKVGKNKELENAVQAQNAVHHDNISNLIVLDFE